MTPFEAHAKQLRFRYAALMVMHTKASICMHPRFLRCEKALKLISLKLICRPIGVKRSRRD